MKLKRPSLSFLNIAQFGAVVNDNIFKLVMVFILIEQLGTQYASTILSIAGGIYVIPFLLFSSAAGILADRHSKKWIITTLKIAEVGIFFLAALVVGTHGYFYGPVGLYGLLFLLGTHSAAFGPSKYSIIPELVTPDKVPKANGLITSSTYLAIIIGTFLASFLSELTNCRYVDVMLFCLGLALLGLLSAFFIQSTPRHGSTRKINPFFLKEIYITLRTCRQMPHLLLILFSSAFFLFIGAYTQLNIIPYTLQGLHMSEIYGGYLFLCTALGIAIGAFVVGKLLKRQIALWIPCLAGFALGILFIALYLFYSSLTAVVIFLVLLGIAGGLFTVPCDSFVQLTCPSEMRGQVIATGNFLSFCGVLIASFLLYFYSEILGLTAMGGFGIMGALTFLYALFLFFRLSDYTLPFLVKTITRPTFSIDIPDLALLEPHSLTPLVLPNGSLPKCALLAMVTPHYHFVFVDEKNFCSRLFLRLFNTMDVLDDSTRTIARAKTRPTCFVLKGADIPPFLPGHLMKVEIIPGEKKDSLLIRFSKYSSKQR